MTKERQIRIMGVDILNSYIELERSRRCASNCPECLAEELYKAGYRKQSEGEWVFDFEWDGDKFYKCSLCNMPSVSGKTHFCSDCGARMKGGEQNG